MKTSIKTSPVIQNAFRVAKDARKRAHAPYSNFKVGAALLASNGEMISGCNIENASYGGAVCAERTAILKAVSAGARDFSDIVVITDSPVPAFPCALCLQVMAEFFSIETKVWVANLTGIKSVHRFGDLLPHPFGPAQLKAPLLKASRKPKK